MRVTAFHMANKVEEAVNSYFLNSMVFSGRKIDVERTSDFRNNVASLQFFLHDGEERIPMGGIEFIMIAEQSGKVAIQWKSNILPSAVVNQAFLILSSSQEHYEQYAKLSDVLRKGWEKDVSAYLPKNEEPPPPVEEAPKSVDDEYASLSPEEIEAITGVKPEPKAASPVPAKQEQAAEATEVAGEEEIKKLMGMMINTPAQSGDKTGAAPVMSEADIAALAKEVQKQAEEPAVPVEKKPDEAKKEEAADDEMSAEEIWKQINGGK
jgi:hypothetical protein